MVTHTITFEHVEREGPVTWAGANVGEALGASRVGLIGYHVWRCSCGVGGQAGSAVEAANASDVHLANASDRKRGEP